MNISAWSANGSQKMIHIGSTLTATPLLFQRAAPPRMFLKNRFVMTGSPHGQEPCFYVYHLVIMCLFHSQEPCFYCKHLVLSCVHLMPENRGSTAGPSHTRKDAIKIARVRPTTQTWLVDRNRVPCRIAAVDILRGTTSGQKRRR